MGLFIGGSIVWALVCVSQMYLALTSEQSMILHWMFAIFAAVMSVQYLAQARKKRRVDAALDAEDQRIRRVLLDETH